MPVYKDKNGSYFIKISINGKQILQRGFQSEEAALQGIINLKSLNELKPKNKKYPYFNDLLKTFLKRKRQLVKITTYEKVLSKINLYIKGIIKNVPVNKLILKDFENFYTFISKRKLSIESKNRILKLLIEIFDYCHIYYGYECLFPKRLILFKDYSIKKPQSDFKIFTYDDFKKIYPGLNDYDKLLLLTFYLFGLRLGELLGLTVLSFKSFENTLCVYQEVSWKTKKKGFELLSPKSKTSNRNYPIPDSYKKMVYDHINKYQLKEDDFIFFGKNGHNRPSSEHAINYRLKKWSEIIGYHLHSHLFRHSAVSQLYANNVPLEVISKLVGHSGTSITKDVYLHQTEEKKKALSTFMEKLMR